jgi:hypothetical protein
MPFLEPVQVMPFSCASKVHYRVQEPGAGPYAELQGSNP